MKTHTKHLSLSAFTIITTLLLVTKPSFARDIASLTGTFDDLFTNIGSIVKIVFRFSMWLSLVGVVYRYIKNKGEWKEMGRWTFGAIIIGVSAEILSALLAY